MYMKNKCKNSRIAALNIYNTELCEKPQFLCFISATAPSTKWKDFFSIVISLFMPSMLKKLCLH